MKGQCGSIFQPYTLGCQCCNGYEYCMKHYKEDNSPGDNYPLSLFEQEIKNNKEKFKRYKPITEAEILVFSQVLNQEYSTIDNFIKVLELYKEEQI